MSTSQPPDNATNERWSPAVAIQRLKAERDAALSMGDKSFDEEKQARVRLREALPCAVESLIYLSQYGETEKIRLDASRYLVDRNLGPVKDGNMVGGDQANPLERLLQKVVDS